MSKKNLLLVLTTEQGYIHNSNADVDFSFGNEYLFTSISNTYIPLLNLLSLLEEEGVNVKLGIVLNASLCTLLSDVHVQTEYIAWLDKRIAFGDIELERNKDNPDILKNVQSCLKKLQKDKIDFIEKYNSNLVKIFKYFADKGIIELIPTAATNIYMPHYADITEVMNAQVETGLFAHKTFFGETGEGFYLPYMGWAKGLDKVLHSYGVNYTIIDARSFLFAEKPCDTGIFTPARTTSSLVVFGRDNETPKDINGESGFITNPVYRCEQRDAGYELPAESLKTFLGEDPKRLQTEFKYWTNTSVYNEEAALQQAKTDAERFYDSKMQKLSQTQEYLEDKDSELVCVIPLETLGTQWHEGIAWLEHLIRHAANSEGLQLSLCKNCIKDQFLLQKIEPYPCSSEGTGYAENLLDNSNNWMMRYIRKASERMVDLTERFPSETGIKARLLNLAARQVLIAESNDWGKMIHEGRLPEFAMETFKDCILNFTAIFDSLASNTVSTEWLCNLEKKDPIFPWINYKVFSRKK
ncbi:MAG: DUF1957 domain-containing protein [Treponema sp.]|nr:DUF1957 domain-containing protein [Treponema sp.]